MKLSSLAIFAFALSLVLAIGCDSDRAFDPIQPSLTMKEFPHSVGDSWTYETYNFTYTRRWDTVVVTILDSNLCIDDDCLRIRQVWEFRSRYRYRLEYVNVSAEEIRMGSLFQYLRMHFPATPGDFWLGLYYPDTIVVTGSGRRRLKDGCYAECFDLTGGFPGDGYYLQHQTTVAAGVGITHWRFDWIPIVPEEEGGAYEPYYQEYRLLEWQVK